MENLKPDSQDFVDGILDCAFKEYVHTISIQSTCDLIIIISILTSYFIERWGDVR